MELQERQLQVDVESTLSSLRAEKVRERLLECVRGLVDEVVHSDGNEKAFQASVLSTNGLVHYMLQDHPRAVAVASDERIASLHYNSSITPPQIIVKLK